MATNPATTPIAPVPPPRNNAVWWILGIIGGGLVVLLILATTFGLFIARNLHLNDTGKNVQISTPVGQIQVNKGAAQETGLPLYPGATETRSGESANVEFIPVEGERLGVAAAKYFTTDPLEKVAAWYTARLGSEFTREASGRRTHRIHGVDVGDADVAFIDDKNDSVRLVALKNLAGGVEIDLARFGKHEAQ